MLDLDQREVGARLGITPQAYSHWENGRTELRVSDLVRLSYALGVPLGTLMRFLDLPIEDRVLTQGQWEDSGRPEPPPLPPDRLHSTLRDRANKPARAAHKPTDDPDAPSLIRSHVA
jgi:transcriptional regulator with XRE-family HTH domain